MKNTTIEIGMRIGRLTVLSDAYTAPNKFGNPTLYHDCKCDCGTMKPIVRGQLQRGTTLSCKCLHREIKHSHAQHGYTGTALYQCWRDMKKRCTLPKCMHYMSYGGRGITFCEEWKRFIPFLDWALANGYQEGLQIDRIDNDGNYEPSNCRWVDGSTNMRNRRSCKMLTAFGETKTFTAWAEDPRCVVSSEAFRSRLRFTKMTPEEAMTKPY